MKYIRHVSSNVGWPYDVLIFFTLERVKISKLNSNERLKLTNLVNEHKEALYVSELKKKS